MKKYFECFALKLLLLMILLSGLSMVKCSSPSGLSGVVQDVRLAPMADTSVAIKDIVNLHVHNASDNVKNVWFLWSFDNGVSFRDSTMDTVLAHKFSLSDTGVKTLYVKTIDGRGKTTGPVSCTIIVREYRPVISSIEKIVLSIGDSVTFRAAGFDTNGTIASYHWAVDGTDFSIMTSAGLLPWTWGFYQAGAHIVRVKALDDDSLFSPVSEIQVIVVPNAPKVLMLTADTAISINDTLVLKAAATDAGEAVSRFAWALNGVEFRDSSSTGALPAVWRKPNAGSHTIRVKAINSHGVESPADSVRVTVLLNAPSVTFMNDTTIFINDTLVPRVQGADTNGHIIKYLWALDGVHFNDSTKTNTLVTVWPRSSAGKRSLKVKAVDNDTLASPADSMVLHVNIGAPFIRPINDTMVSLNDTVLAKITAFDTNGTITTYFWNTHNPDVNESSTSNSKKIYRGASDTQNVFVGVMDDDGNITSDTFAIYYNNPPRHLSVAQPAPDDTVVFRLLDSTFVKGRVLFRFAAVDPDGLRDTLRYFLFLGKAPGSLSLAYSGTDTTFTLAGADTARYYWKIVCKDRYGDSAAASGAFFCLLQKTICFSGHSIIAGDGGDGKKGGFRADVLAALRKPNVSAKCVQPIGPLFTGFIKNSSDDSCFALSGSFAPMMYTLMTQSFPLLNADFWVFMIGVNKTYNNAESQYTISMIDEIHRRNPNAGIYVLNGLPYFDYYSWAYQDRVHAYNSTLADSAAARRSKGWRIWVVDAFSLFAQKDSTLNPDYSVDGIHPNQAGYDLIGKAVIDTMQAHP